ncbi:hypothetical protein J5N97_015322 [Dioscorea zingiberensis]|uniref:Uncharacterized protein n=1 Tax=Dioscorea zingiberensis TaxID=325984 RepID=A0A9D5HKL0_9LILI|nr:hypothetical protein J5N97_015322 [Dioscorea zingiberensis]
MPSASTAPLATSSYLRRAKVDDGRSHLFSDNDQVSSDSNSDFSFFTTVALDEPSSIAIKVAANEKACSFVRIAAYVHSKVLNPSPQEI